MQAPYNGQQPQGPMQRPYDKYPQVRDNAGQNLDKWGNPRLCFLCKSPGHFKADCPQRVYRNYDYGSAMVRNRNQQEEFRISMANVITERKTYLEGEIFGIKHWCLLDTGCDRTILPERVVQRQNINIARHHLYAANKTKIAVLGEINTTIKFDGEEFRLNAAVSSEISEPLIGIDWLSANKVNWETGSGKIYIKGKEFRLSERNNLGQCKRLIATENLSIPPRCQTHVMADIADKEVQPHNEPPKEWISESGTNQNGLWIAGAVLPPRNYQIPLRVMNTSENFLYIRKGATITGASEVEICQSETYKSGPPNYEHVDGLLDGVYEGILPEDKEKLKRLLHQYSTVFSDSEYDLGKTGIAQHSIDTGENRPIKQALRRSPFSQLQLIDDQVQDMLKHNIIEPSLSPWASNVVIVKKKDGSSRFCVDYRKLNDLTRKDAYPLPRIETCLDALGGAKYFSTFDLRSGYHHVEMAPEDADKTSFVTRQGTYRFTVLPFGLCNAGSTFQRVMDVALSGLNMSILLVYLDDIIVFSENVSDHLTRLQQLFDRLHDANLRLKPSKCCLLRTKVSFLGHIVSDMGIATDPEKIEMVKDWPAPKNLTELRSFVELCSYYRKFVEGFASIARPLHELTGKDKKFVWSKECQTAFEHLKEKLCTSPILAMPLNEGKYIVDCDASGTCLGAVLSQVQDGEEKVIAFASRTLNTAERNYCVTRKELLAVVYYIKAFKQYLLGREVYGQNRSCRVTVVETNTNPNRTAGKMVRCIR